MLESRRIEMDFELTLLKGEAPAGIQSGSWSLEEERTLEVVESKAQAITKLAITYGRRDAKPLLGIERTAATAGKSYVLEAGASEPSVLRADGAKPSDDERTALLTEYRWVGQPAPLIALLSERRLAPGAQIEASAEAKRAIVGEISGIDPASADLALTFESMRSGGRKQALLRASGVAILDNGDVRFELELAGPVVVDLDTGFLSETELSGKLKATGKVKHKKGLLDARGKGTVRLVRKAQF
jgi:hypothetical protein